MLRPLPDALPATALPTGCQLDAVPAAAFAECVGALRGTPMAQRRAHAERMQQAPVQYQGFVLRQRGETVACGQLVLEEGCAGLYDVFTALPHRGLGHARALCVALLGLAREQGAEQAYLQVDAGNEVARRLYGQLGFTDGYAYHYRSDAASAK